MDASESPPNSFHRHHQHPHLRNTHAPAPYQASSDTDTTNTPDTLITPRRTYSTFPNRHYQYQHGTTHRSVRCMSSNDTPGLGAQTSLVDGVGPSHLALSSIQQQQQQQQQQQTIVTATPLLPYSTTIVSPAPSSTRFNFAAFWNPQRFFSAVRPTSTPLPSVSPGPSPSSSSGTIYRLTISGEGGDSLNPTPAPSTISKSSSSPPMPSLLVGKGEYLSQGGQDGQGVSPRRSSLGIKPVSASTIVTLPPCSNPGPSMSSTSDRRLQVMLQSQPQQDLASVPDGFNVLSMPRSGSNSGNLNSTSGSTERSGSSGAGSSSCYPSPTSPDSLSTSTAAALERVQKRIVQGQAQLIQYTEMIQKHETDRARYLTLQAGHLKQREVLENEMEALESAIRQDSSTPISPLSSFFSSANSFFGQGGGNDSAPGHFATKRSSPSFFSWSSPPPSYEEDQDWHQEQSATCCPFKAALIKATTPTSFSSAPTHVITAASDFASTTAFPRISPTVALLTTNDQSLPSFSPCSPSSFGPFISSGPTRSRSTSSLHVTFSSDSSSSLSSSSKSHISDHQPQDKSQPTPSTQSPQSLPLSLPSTPSATPAAAAVLLKMCRRCDQKSSLAERRDLLRSLQRGNDQVQQKIHSTNSQIRHLQRTFILPIETYLQEDQEELSRLLQLQMVQSQRERHHYHHQQQHDGGGGESRPSSGSSSNTSRGGGGGGGGVMYRRK